MEKNFEQFIEQAKKINLSTEERSLIERSILNFIKDNPIHAQESVRLNNPQRLGYQNGANPSFWSSIFLTKLNFVSTMAIILLLSILVTGGVAVGAEKSLPGDTLYPVKVGINEEVRGWLTISEEAKANWEVERAQRRLEEAEEMAGRGSLDVEIREKIEANFQAHADKVKDRIEKFENKENFKTAADVSAKFETSLKAHEKILNRLEGEVGASKELKPIRIRIRSQVDKTRKNREEMEIRSGGRINVEIEKDEDNEDESEDEVEINSESEVESGGSSVNSETNLRLNVGL